jgi:hypothetical protein
MRKTMNKRRLLKLADLLEADAKNKKGIRFSYFNWGVDIDPKKPLSCGTRACAMGLAALSGAFKRAGMGYKIKKNGGLVITHGNSESPMRAAMRTFDLTFSQADYLFTNSSGMTMTHGATAEREVAQRIRQFVAAGG